MSFSEFKLFKTYSILKKTFKKKKHLSNIHQSIFNISALLVERGIFLHFICTLPPNKHLNHYSQNKRLQQLFNNNYEQCYFEKLNTKDGRCWQSVLICLTQSIIKTGRDTHHVYVWCSPTEFFIHNGATVKQSFKLHTLSPPHMHTSIDRHIPTPSVTLPSLLAVGYRGRNISVNLNLSKSNRYDYTFIHLPAVSSLRWV